MNLISREYVEKLLAQKDAIMATKEYIEFLNKFQRKEYSMFNKLLVFSQDKQATDVRGFASWLKLGRQVKKGEISRIRICVKGEYEKEDAKGEKKTTGFFKYMSVFDISQTEEKDLSKTK